MGAAGATGSQDARRRARLPQRRQARHEAQRRAAEDHRRSGDLRGHGRRRAAAVRAGEGPAAGAALLSVLIHDASTATCSAQTRRSRPGSSRTRRSRRGLRALGGLEAAWQSGEVPRRRRRCGSSCATRSNRPGARRCRSCTRPRSATARGARRARDAFLTNRREPRQPRAGTGVAARRARAAAGRSTRRGTRARPATLPGHRARCSARRRRRSSVEAADRCSAPARGVLRRRVRLGIIGPLRGAAPAASAQRRHRSPRRGARCADRRAHPRRPRRCSICCRPRTTGCTRGCFKREGGSRAGPRSTHHAHDHEHDSRGPAPSRARHAAGRDYRHARVHRRHRRPGRQRQDRAAARAVPRAARSHSLAVVTNDIFTKEDAEFLVRNEALPPSGSPPSRPAAARTPRSATTSARTSRRWTG